MNDVKPGLYRSVSQYHHGKENKIGVLLVNLGTPEAPTTGATRRYLRQFLSDRRVIEASRWTWLPILYLAVLPFRSSKSAKKYASIWTDKGSPLMVISRQQTTALQQQLDKLSPNVLVELGMSYGKPSIEGVLSSLKNAGCNRILILPAYPQYAGSTIGSVFDSVSSEISTWRRVPHLRFVSGYHNHPGFIAALAASIRNHWDKHGKPQQLVFSFHGTPVASLHQGDPYHCQCHETARLTAETLKLKNEEWIVTFQSRFGPTQWLQPYTDKTLEALPKKDVRDIQIVCPAFSADCLETLEEIDEENREIFLSAGGEKFSYIPALNDNEHHIEFLASLVKENCDDWCRAQQRENDPATRQLRSEKARQLRTSGPNADGIQETE